MKVVISSGHGLYVRGASGFIDEVDEARRVVSRSAAYLSNHRIGAVTFNDDVSTTQNENLDRIVAFHNSHQRDLDVSVHFNAYEVTEAPMGCECLYISQSTLATEISKGISAASGLNDRGAKKRTDLAFLNRTNKPAVLIEVCFVDSQADVDLYQVHFDAICEAIAKAVSGDTASAGRLRVTGKVSHFGGPNDTGVSPSEGLAFISQVEQAPQLFLPYQPPGTTGLARRLNPNVHYIACRWDYAKTPKPMLLEKVALVRATKTGIKLKAFPADWGPNADTGRVADISPGLMDDLGLTTDDVVEVSFPA